MNGIVIALGLALAGLVVLAVLSLRLLAAIRTLRGELERARDRLAALSPPKSGH